jgi:ferredoxin
MPVIHYHGYKIACEHGENLRKALLSFPAPLYNGMSKYMNCRGLGSCGTCAVWIRGIISQKSRVEKLRLKFPPHQEKPGLRLACQVRVWGDIEVVKGEGFWGQKYSLEKKRINKSQNQPEGNN